MHVINKEVDQQRNKEEINYYLDKLEIVENNLYEMELDYTLRHNITFKDKQYQEQADKYFTSYLTYIENLL